MTKTHSSDNMQLDTVKRLIRTAEKLNATTAVPSPLSRNIVMASVSVFALADEIHLGRTRTRRELEGYAHALTRAIELAQKEGVK
jgi:hypothetical protein